MPLTGTLDKQPLYLLLPNLINSSTENPSLAGLATARVSFTAWCEAGENPFHTREAHVAQYPFLKTVVARIIRRKQGSNQQDKGLGLPQRRMAFMASPVAVILFASTYSVATPIHFPMETWPIIEMDGVTVTQSPAAHSALLAAAFGFQSVGSSTITVRTYDGPTGAILSEDAFDVNVKEEGVAEHDENRGTDFCRWDRDQLGGKIKIYVTGI